MSDLKLMRVDIDSRGRVEAQTSRKTTAKERTALKRYLEAYNGRALTEYEQWQYGER